MSNPEAQFEIVSLKSGVKSLRSLETGQIFHPGIGPTEEARILHVEQQKLAERCRELPRFTLWDVGFGAAANALAAIDALADCPAQVEVHSFDQSLAPIEFALTHSDALSYIAPHREAVARLLAQGSVQVHKRLRWHFHLGDFRREMEKGGLPAPDAIFYDPYSPAKNAEMWTLAHFARLRAKASNDCLLTTYSRSTAVRVTFLLAGFFVGAGRVLGEKDETTVAATRFTSLERPLRTDWFDRVRSSHHSAPFRDSTYSIAPISAEDFAQLRRHEQFGIPADWPAAPAIGSIDRP